MRFTKIFLSIVLLFPVANAGQIEQNTIRDPIPEDFQTPESDDYEVAVYLISDCLNFASDWEMLPDGDKAILDWWLNFYGGESVWYRANLYPEHPNYDLIIELCDELDSRVSTADSILYMPLVGAQFNHEESKSRALAAAAILQAPIPEEYPNIEARDAAARAKAEDASDRLDNRIRDQIIVIEHLNNCDFLYEMLFNSFWTY